MYQESFPIFEQRRRCDQVDVLSDSAYHFNLVLCENELLGILLTWQVEWLGLTPKQFASGNKSVHGGITKRGDGYLRKQLIHGARTVVSHASKKNDDLNQWITQLRSRKSICTTVVATAHRLARLMWILLQKQVLYVPQYGSYQGVSHEKINLVVAILLSSFKTRVFNLYG